MRFPHITANGSLPTSNRDDSNGYKYSMLSFTNNLTLRRRLAHLRYVVGDKIDGLRRRTIVGIIFGLLTFIILIGHLSGMRISRSSGKSSGYKTDFYQKSWKDAPYGPRNSTLGFQKIYYLSMKDRTDRQDMMTLIAGYLDLDFTMVEAVNGSIITDKAKPYDVKNPKHIPRPAELGCWRSHANIWANMISEGVSSALILEDDVDFTSGIRDVMDDISTHLQHLTGARNNEPYGLISDKSWDILSLGHCYYGGEEVVPENKFPKASKIFEAWEDDYAPRNDAYSNYLPWSIHKRIRLLIPTWSVLCTQGYAISREGAMRLLYNIGGPGGDLEMPVDMAMAEKMRAGLLKGYVTLPNLIAQWKYGNWKDTDIQPTSKEELEKNKGSGWDVVGSVREEIEKKLGPGGRNIWKDLENQK